MSDASLLRLSIDLEAELASITERQHLNQVHWAVQLVRHALERRPRRVDVRVRARTLELAHDGESLSADEHALLLAVTRGPDDDKQAALAELEARFGVTLLSLLLTAPRVELHGRFSLVAEGGRVRAGPPRVEPGYRVRVWRRGGSARQEKEELRFYCRHADVPLTLDGRLVNEPIALERAIAGRRFRSDDGEGLVGLPARGALSRLRYFKRGVYFGVRQSLPSDGRPLEACFDTKLDEHEDNFERSVRLANRAVRAAGRQLYADLPSVFPSLPPRGRARVKDLVLGASSSDLPDALRRLPLFATSASSWRLSLDDLDALARRYGRVPYLAARRGLDDELPVLSSGELAAVERLLGVPVRAALRFQPPVGVLGVVRRALGALFVSGRRRSTRARTAVASTMGGEQKLDVQR